MKKISLTITFCILAISLSFAGGRIRSIIFADTFDPRIGTGVQGNLQDMETMIYELGTALDMEDDVESPLTFAGNDCSVENLRNCLSNFSCGPNDIVIFCYFGHGTRARNDKSYFPQMCVRDETTNPEDFIPLEDVENYLRAKNPRLLLVLGDCCNSVFDGLTPKFGVLRAASSSVVRADSRSLYKQLFLDFSGSIIMSGSQPGHPSLYCVPKNDVGYGWFTYNFLTLLWENEYATDNMSWEKFMEATKTSLYNFSTEMKKNYPNDPIVEIQTPIYRITPKDPIRNNQQPMTDKQITQNNNMNVRPQGDTDYKDVVDALRSLSNSSRRNLDRILDVDKVFGQFFYSNVTVHVVGRDGKTVLDVYNGKDYLSHIATVSRLSNFEIKNVKLSGNKISFMWVHEIYVE